jgi:hypothetical protein
MVVHMFPMYLPVSMAVWVSSYIQESQLYLVRPDTAISRLSEIENRFLWHGDLELNRGFACYTTELSAYQSEADP